MTQVLALRAGRRDGAGKGPARQTRRAGKVPAVIYGNKESPLLISLERDPLERLLRAPGFFTHLFDLDVDGQPQRVLPRDVQMDPVSDRPIHVDFLRVTAGTRIRVEIPIHFLNQDKAPGIKRGGVLNIVLHEIELSCPADQIPEALNIDLTGLDIGDSIHRAALQLPAGAELTTREEDFTIATIVAPSAVLSETAEAAPTAEAAAAPAAAAAGKPAAAGADKAKAAAPAADKAKK